jgi:FkbM family methyltransferase
MKTFVEIGSCDFDTCNPLAEQGWRGVIVEPVKKYLNNLEQHSNVIYLNMAIHNHDGWMLLYPYTDEQCEEDKDYRGMTTYQLRDTKRQYELAIRCISYQTLIRLCGFHRIDLLKIDAEGMDFLILEQAFHQGMPKPIEIIVEHKYLDDVMMCEFLSSQGYTWRIDESNIYAKMHGA